MSCERKRLRKEWRFEIVVFRIRFKSIIKSNCIEFCILIDFFIFKVFNYLASFSIFMFTDGKLEIIKLIINF